MIDAVAYMTDHSERPTEVVESDAAYAAAVQALCAAVPAQLRTLVLDLESATTTRATQPPKRSDMMKLIITGPLPSEYQEINLSDEAQIELRLPDGASTSLRLAPEPATNSTYHSIEVRASPAIAWGEVRSNGISFLIPAIQEAADAH